jgi:restriction endonuclease Mrr
VISISFGDLPAESLKLKTKSGTNVLADRIGWGKPYLKQAKMIKYPVRGQVKITSKGLEILNQVDLTLKELSNDPDYLACQDSKSEKRSTKSMKQRRINHMIYQTKKKLTLLLS